MKTRPQPFHMSITIPATYCLGGTQSGHRMMRCMHTKTINGVKVQCMKRFRVAALPIQHEHVYPIVMPTKVIDTETAKNKITENVSTLIAACNMSISSSTNKAMMELITSCISIGQKFQNVPLLNLVPTINPITVSSTILKIGEHLKIEELQPFLKIFTTLMIDASTLVHKRILCIMLSANDQSCKPKTLDSIHAPKLGVEEYRNIMIPVIENLLKMGVKIGGIVGDNCPTQVLAFAHWSPSSIFKGHPCAEISGIRFFSCGVHTTALMLSDCLSASIELQRLVSTLTEMVDAVNSSFAKNVVGHCPKPVATRWLSRINGIDWLLLHEDSLRSLSSTPGIEPSEKRELEHVFTFAHFEELRVLAKLIYPFHALTLALEKDDSTQ